jgi:hypothetical protein
MATLALFFALGGGAMAANAYIRSSDTIPSGDLAGSTYGSPLIASGAVTNAKLANPSLSVNSGTGLSGGGSVALGGSTTLGVANGGINTAQLHDGSVTTAKFDSGAQAPDSAKLGGNNPSDYGAVMSARMNGLRTTQGSDFGAISGISTASATEGDVTMLSPNHDLVVRDLSIELTAPLNPGAGRSIQLDVNGTGTLGCIFGLFGTGTSCQNPGTRTVPANSRLSIEDFANDGAAPSDVRVSFRLTP